MPIIKLENGMTINISQESYDELAKAASRDWRDAVEQFKEGFAFKTSAQKTKYKGKNGIDFYARMQLKRGFVRSLREKAIVCACLENGGYIEINHNYDVLIRPGKEIMKFEEMSLSIMRKYFSLLKTATKEELEKNKLFNRSDVENKMKEIKEKAGMKTWA